MSVPPFRNDVVPGGGVEGDEGGAGLGHAGLLPWNLICPKATAPPPGVQAKRVSRSGCCGRVSQTQSPLPSENPGWLKAKWVSQSGSGCRGRRGWSAVASCEDSFHGIGIAERLLGRRPPFKQSGCPGAPRGCPGVAPLTDDYQQTPGSEST